MTPKFYGKLDSEKIAEDNHICRTIVKEISDFGVSQRQLLMIIYLLSIQLENVEHMKTLTQLIKEIEGGMFIMDNQADYGDEIS